MKNNFRDFLKKSILDKNVIISDGGFGTEILKRGIDISNIPPEVLNVKNQKVVAEIHREYIKSGANFITTNTFGANRYKLAEYGMENELKNFLKNGIEIAQKVVKEFKDRNDLFVVASIGPIGKLLEPLGDMKIEEVISIYKEIFEIIKETKPDAVILETMLDIQEIRIAVTVAREITDIPIIASPTFENGERMTTGTPVDVATVILQDLEIDVIGANCSTGPDEMKNVVSKIKSVLKTEKNIPIIIQANAGNPIFENGKTVFPLNANDFASSMHNILLEGANIIGGCCGTTPEHIKKIFELKHNFVEVDKVFERFFKKNKLSENQKQSYFASRTKLVSLKKYPLMLGERINPNALKKIKEAIKNKTFSAIIDEARLQIENGADILDVNISVPNIDEPKMMKDVISAVSKVVNVPFCIDSPDYRALESGLKYFCGKALVNSVNGENERIEKILPIVKKYGASVIALTIDENGIPDTVDGRLKIAEKIIKECEKINIGVDDIFVDALVLTISTNPKGAKTTLETIRQVKKEFGVRTILGLSNISFGLPGREVINSNFLSMAIESGLDIAITNPNNELLRNSFYSSSLLCGYDIGAEKYINSFYQNDLKDQSLKIEKVVDLKDAIIEGLKDKAIELVIKELAEKPELEIINKIIIPALDVVGAKYEKGEYFLPQLLMSAETAQEVSKTIQDKMEKEGKSKIDNLDKTIVFATVKGDLHDIGKNIVISVLKNYSYNVIDLGKSISNEIIIEEALKNNAKAIGLSALMTTTMQQMSELIDILEERNLRERFKVFVGGAVVTEDYARTIKADGYGKDATDTVNLLRKLGI